jgi:hypothetical protein
MAPDSLVVVTWGLEVDPGVLNLDDVTDVEVVILK